MSGEEETTNESNTIEQIEIQVVSKVGQRIIFNGDKATVRYCGPLRHAVTNSKIKVDDEWLGVEWDNPAKGKHNGTVEGYEYFKWESGVNSGSLILSKKSTFGIEIVEALIRRYFKAHEVHEILRHKDNILEYLKQRCEELKAKYEQDKKNIIEKRGKLDPASLPEGYLDERKKAEEENIKKAQEEKANSNISKEVENALTEQIEVTKEGNKADDADNMFEEDSDDEEKVWDAKVGRKDAVKNLKDKIHARDWYRDKVINVEYDEDAFIHTFDNRFKKIEFKGFDKVWERIYQLDRILDLGLNETNISSFGNVGTIVHICPRLMNLSIERNLFQNWSQIIAIGTELKNLEILYISYNIMKVDDEGYLNRSIKYYNDLNQEVTIEDISTVFPRLQKLVAIGWNLDWKKLNLIMPFFQHANELILCKNNMLDFEDADWTLYDNITSINLEDNNISNDNNFGLLHNMKNLVNLSLNANSITRFQDCEKFTKLEWINLNKNLILDGKWITDLRSCPVLRSLRVQHNPIEDGINKREIRRRAVAEISTLKSINGTDLAKYERKDCEYYFLNWVFQEYFKIFNLNQLSYRFADFEKWAKEAYPAIFDLIAKHENPFPEIHSIEGDKEEEMKILKEQMAAKNFVKIYFSTLIGPNWGKPPMKKTFPKNTDFLYIRNWASQIFKIKNKEQMVIKFRNTQSQVYEVIDDMTKTIEFYDIFDGADLLVEEKDS